MAIGLRDSFAWLLSLKWKNEMGLGQGRSLGAAGQAARLGPAFMNFLSE